MLNTDIFAGDASPVTRGRRRGEAPPRKLLASPWKNVLDMDGLKLLDIVQKLWAPLRKLFAPPGVPSWLRAWLMQRDSDTADSGKPRIVYTVWKEAWVNL